MNFCFQRVVTSGSQARRMPPLNDEKKQEEALRREATELLAQHRAPRRRRGAHRPRSSCAATRQRCANIKSIDNSINTYSSTLLFCLLFFAFRLLERLVAMAELQSRKLVSLVTVRRQVLLSRLMTGKGSVISRWRVQQLICGPGTPPRVEVVAAAAGDFHVV